MRTRTRPDRGWTSVILIAVAMSVLSAAGPAPGADDTAAAMWQAVEQIPPRHAMLQPWIRPVVFQAFDLDPDVLQATLAEAPLEFTVNSDQITSTIALPMPDGTMARFLFVESPVMAPALAAKYPQIKTYLGQGIDDPMATVRFDSVPSGFHAQILSPNGTVYIDPYTRGDARLHVSYYKKDYVRQGEPFQCLTNQVNAPRIAPSSQSIFSIGETLHKYRVAIAARGEYTAFFGGTVADGLAAIVVALNRVTGIYEADVAVRMELVPNNDLIVYTDSGSDPYSGGCGSLLSQNQSNLDNVIGSANYDIGHVFGVGSGGCASLGVICSGSKARGQTGLNPPTGDPFYVDFVSHEMGHQFGGSHTFNGVTGSCSGGNRSGAHAYEPGSGATIMAYAGICGSDNLQSNSDPYFHFDSIDFITNHVTNGSGANCPVEISTGNLPPTVDAGSNFTIPQQTPFILTAASWNDPDGDPITFVWEEADLGPAQNLSQTDNGSSPLFRSWNPTTDPSRTFPRLSDLLNNTTAPGEQLPSTDRDMNFRLTVRDNHAFPSAGGIGWDTMTVTVITAAGPFNVVFPNGGTVGDSVTVSWDVAGTNLAPISVTSVNILLSTNGGTTFPTVLASNTPNDGSETVSLVGVETTTGRIKVEAVGNVFFDVSDDDVAINPNIDSTAPDPNPMTFDTPPTGISTTEITMMATLAIDADSPPVEYEFEFVNGGAGGTSSGWQSSRNYTDTGLDPDTQYSYRVRARDSAPVPNVTAFSATLPATTDAPVCGDGNVEGNEQCDPPNGVDCGPDCQFLPVVCGDGNVQGAEECDPPDGVVCGDDCMFLPVCGDGVVEGTEQCDPPDGGVNCDDNCQTIPPVCGNGIVQNGEGCDPPDGVICDDNCLLINAVCGNGAVEGTEQCDPPDGITCDANCQTIAECELDTDCDDGNICTDDTCVGGTCVFTNNNVSCNFEFCFPNDVCSGGVCVPGPELDCDDGNPCTDDSCHPAFGCQNVANNDPCDDGDPCTANDACADEVCTGDPVEECDDGNACTTNGVCVNGECLGGEPVDCDDGNPCTDDSCDPESGCAHANSSGGACDDGDACTTNDLCAEGACVGQGVLDCDDENECTDDSCDPQSGCRNVNNAVACDDQSICTVNDRCTSGACAGTENLYGDVNHDGQINLDDILCVLDGFQGDFSSCSERDVDIAGCAPSGLIDLPDILAVLDAFEGTDACCR